jgi:hypothetical protein
VNIEVDRSSPVTLRNEETIAENGATKSNHDLPSASKISIDRPRGSCYLGISEPLLLTLVDVYFENVYQSDLLLHKRMFLKSLAEGTTREHVILSICAFAAKYGLM